VKTIKRIFLVRHGESEFNVNPVIGQTRADHSIKLTTRGQEQAELSGSFLLEWLNSNVSPANYGRIRVWTSPYVRTRQTSKAVSSAVRGWILDIRENILLCEQQFGLFDGIPVHELHNKFPEEAAYYDKCQRDNGRFWGRFPLGESRFDVATRIHQSFGTLHRDAERHGIDNVIIICHGVTMRAFLMMWFHLTPEWFDDEPNPANCAIRLIEGGEDKGYIFNGFETE